MLTVLFNMEKKERFLLPDNLHDDIAFSGAVVKINEDNLLPCAQSRPSFDDRNRKRRFH